VNDQREQQIKMRAPIVEFLQGDSEMADGDSIVIGFTLLVEIIDRDGERGAFKITSDASGVPLPWYTVDGHSAAITTLGEFDEDGFEDEQ
jgi:hypothetical protein